MARRYNPTAEVLGALLGLMAAVVGIILCLTWFGWQLLLVIWLILWGNNAGQRGNR